MNTWVTRLASLGIIPIQFGLLQLNKSFNICYVLGGNCARYCEYKC